PPSGNLGYMIAIDLPEACSTSSGSIKRSFSNRVDVKARMPMLFPNPTKDRARVTGEIPSMIKIFDLSGRLVMEVEKTDQFSVAHFHRGIYLVCLYDEKGIIYFREKLVKR